MAAPTIVHSQWSALSGDPGTYALGFTPTAGNILLALRAIRGTWTTGSPGAVRNFDVSGTLWTNLTDYGGDAPFGGGGSGYWDSGIAASKRVSDGTETHVWVEKNGSSGGGVLVLVEIAGFVGSTLTAVNGNLGAAATASSPAVGLTDAALVIGWLSQGSDFPAATRDLGAGTGWTVLYTETTEQPERWKPHPIAVYAAVAGGSPTPDATSDQSAPGWSGLTVGFVGPHADFLGTPLTGIAPLSVTFTDLSDFSPTAWDWDFGDGTSHSHVQNPTHVYATPGTYTVSLTASVGATSDTEIKTGYVVVEDKGIALDVYEIVPPGDSITFLATLDGAFDKVIRPERNATGSGMFSIRRDDPKATAAILAKGNLVKARVPAIDANPIFAFFIETSTVTVVSPDEGGGEILTIGGKGALAYWDWARWLAVSYVIPWWDAGWADLVAGKPPAGSIGHVALVAGDYWVYTVTNGRIASRTQIHYSAFQAFYSSRKSYKWAAGTAYYGRSATLVHLSTSAHSGIYLHPMDPGITEVRASAVLGLRPEFGDMGASAVTQWWLSGWGAPPGGTLGRLVLAAGTYFDYTVSGGKITGHTTFTTGGLSAWYDSRASYPFASGVHATTSRRTLVQLSSGTLDNHYLYPSESGITDYQASEPVVSLFPGKVLFRVAEEVQNADRPSHPMPLLTYDFTEELDSDGNQWTNTASLAGITADVGESYESTVQKILSTGVIDVEMGPDLDFHAWNERGRDLTGGAFATGVVRFQKAVNIATALKREEADGPVPTYTQVVGNDGWASAVLPDAASRVARETTTQVSTDDDSALAAAGLADLIARLVRSDAAGFAIVVGNDEANGLYLPGPPGSTNGKFWLGDVVTLHTGTDSQDYNEESVRVAAITLSETESGDLVCIPEVNSSLGAAEDAAFPGSAGFTPSGGGSSGGGGTTVVTTTTSDLSGYQLMADKGAINGYAGLDASALVPIAQMPTELTGPDYLVGTAQGGLSAEIVVGTTPGGELGGTWASPTVDGTHSGSSHAATEAAAIAASLGLPIGLTGAIAATRYVGATTSGAPASGTFATGDFVIDQSGSAWICTAPGTPGTWVALGGTSAVTRTAIFGFDGGGAAVTAGKTMTIRFAAGGTISGWYILSDGLVTVDLWKTTYTAYDDSTHPVVGDSICSAAKPAVSSGVKGSSTSLGAWSSTTISTDDVIRAHVDSAAATWAVLHLIYA